MTFAERKALVRSYLGKMVDIEIDRPLGSTHPKHEKTIYKLNYGYVPGVMGGDGKELDVYLMGVYRPVKRFRARIIGIVHRRHDKEDKLVAAPRGMEFHQAEIEEAVRFCEKYFPSYVESIFEKSCGTVSYTLINGRVHYLLIRSRDGYCSFPKGHMERGESETDTALRETWEETSVRSDICSDKRWEISYSIGRGKHKKVVYFLATFKDQKPCRNEDFENNEVLLLPYEEALAALTHRDTKRMLTEADATVKKAANL